MYLHGLNGRPNPEKLDVLKAAGCAEIIAPQIDYDAQTPDEIFGGLYARCEQEPPSLIFGSSMGGYMAYWLGRSLELPVFLLNPALNQRTDPQYNLKYGQTRGADKRLPAAELVIGLKDGIIPPLETLYFVHLEENKPGELHYQFWPDTAHRWPLPAFERAVRHSELLKTLRGEMAK